MIGNPPYIQLQKDGGKLADIYKNKGFETFERSGDLYSLFYEKGVNLLNNNGNLNYITSNKWMRANYGKTTRAFFCKHRPLKLIDLGSDVFETATVDTNILLIEKKGVIKDIKSLTITKALDLSKEKNITNFSRFDNDWVNLFNISDKAWTIINPKQEQIKRKIESIGKPLKNWNINIYRGVLTGFNEAFIIDTATKEKICHEDPNSIEIIEPILRGRDVKRYKAEWEGLWLIATHNGYKNEEGNKVDAIKVNCEKAFKSISR